MNDREMLALAAKALGNPNLLLNGGVPDYTGRGDWKFVNLPDKRADNYPTIWNPLKSDGDALRLAIDLSIGIEIDARETGATYAVPGLHPMAAATDTIYEEYTGDPAAATRRAIVRAAAAIGKGKPDETSAPVASYVPNLPWRFVEEGKGASRNEILDAADVSITGDEQYYPWAPSESEMRYIVEAVNAYGKGAR